ncbi:MAG: hypothetical protein KJ955_06880 [Nanoarchaeota archaeon]|nr:hypothetical protein [Nanoarchaeota archaeon]
MSKERPCNHTSYSKTLCVFVGMFDIPFVQLASRDAGEGHHALRSKSFQV